MESSNYGETATNCAIICQRMARLQSSAIQSKDNYFNISARQFTGTACIRALFLCMLCHDVPPYIHTIIEYRFQTQYSFQGIIVVVIIIMNV